MQDFPSITIDEINFWDLEPIPHACIRLVEGQVWEEFMLGEKVCNVSLPKLFKAKESLHTNEVELEIPKIYEVEIGELPREVELEIPIEQDKSNLHNKRKKVLESKIIRRANPTKLVKKEVCRPPPKPPDRENSLNLRHETKKGRVRPYKNKKKSQEGQKIDRKLNYRPPPKLPYILHINGEVIGIIENVVPKTRHSFKPPRIHGSVDREETYLEKESLLNTVLNQRPPSKPPPNGL